MSQLTRRQHYVPDFYLSQWANPTGQVTCHDLAKDVIFTCNPANTLVQSYFYEEDPASPDNRIEKILSVMEGACAATFKKITSISATAASDRGAGNLAESLRRELGNDDLDNLSQFAAYQYLRVPGAIDQKAYELQPSDLTEAERVHALNPGRFVESGYAYVNCRFKAMKMLMLVSPDREFITSDWPCFDMKDSPNSPLLGEEIGRDPGVICYMPLAPKVAIVFFTVASSRTPRLTITQSRTDADIRNQNALVIQKAERFVIASREESFIFKVAAKRKKGRPAG
jgi:hypothetical protein